MAAGALRFGEPVLDTRITAVGPHGLRYRGRNAVELARTGVGFEDVASLLWACTPPTRAWPWPKADLLERPSTRAPLLWRLARLVPRLALADASRAKLDPSEELRRARRIVRAFAASVGPKPEPTPPSAGIAATMVRQWRLPAAVTAAIDTALVLLADHELNVSTFAARVAASGGADLYACVGAGLYAFAGPRHGGSADRISAFVDDVGSPRRAKSAMQKRLREGRPMPGFGQPLYPEGDPRVAPLLEWAALVDPGRQQRRLTTLLALHEAALTVGAPPMSVDGALLALAYALGLPPTAATAMFCVGRTVGWVAHVFEQRAQGALLRPRARYVGLEAIDP